MQQSAIHGVGGIESDIGNANRKSGWRWWSGGGTAGAAVPVSGRNGLWGGGGFRRRGCSYNNLKVVIFKQPLKRHSFRRSIFFNDGTFYSIQFFKFRDFY